MRAWLDRSEIQMAMRLVLLVLIAVLLYLLRVAAPVDSLWLDFMFRSFSEEKAAFPEAALVLMSDSTSRALGVERPIPRRFYARYIEKVHSLGASAQIIDLYLKPLADSSADREIISASFRCRPVVFTASLDDPLTNVPSLSGFDDMAENELYRVVLPFDGKYGADRLYSGIPALRKDKFLNRGTIVGLRGWYSDGRVCWLPTPALAFALATGKNVEAVESMQSGDHAPPFLSTAGALRVGGRLFYCVDGRQPCLPLNFFRFRKGCGFRVYRFEDILQKEYPEGFFRGCHVFLGNEVAGHDYHETPVGEMLGPAILATALENFLHDRFIYPLNPALIVVLIIFTGAGAGTVFFRLSPQKGLPLLIASFIAVLGLSVLLFNGGMILEISPFLFTLAASYLSLSLRKSMEAEDELLRHQRLFEGMLITKEGTVEKRELLKSLLALVCNRFGCAPGWILGLREDGITLEAEVACTPLKDRSELAGGLCGQSLESGGYELCSGFQGRGRQSPFERRQRFHQLLCIPLTVKDEKKGVLALGKRFPASFTLQEIRQLLATGTIISFIMDNIDLSRRAQELFLETISSLARAMEARDPYTYGHSARVTDFCREISLRGGLSDDEMRKIEIAALLHDVGKIGVPEKVLNKPGKLTEEEFDIMKKHPETAARILSPIDELYSIIPYIRGHHEKLNGKGYPDALKGEEIPVGARIIAVADVYDALTSERPYRRQSTPEEAIAMMEKHFSGELDFTYLEHLKAYLKNSDRLFY